MSQILYINILVDWSLSGIMTSKLVIREPESPRPVASSILISRMTSSSVIIPYIKQPSALECDEDEEGHSDTEDRIITEDAANLKSTYCLYRTRWCIENYWTLLQLTLFNLVRSLYLGYCNFIKPQSPLNEYFSYCLRERQLSNRNHQYNI